MLEGDRVGSAGRWHDVPPSRSSHPAWGGRGLHVQASVPSKHLVRRVANVAGRLAAVGATVSCWLPANSPEPRTTSQGVSSSSVVENEAVQGGRAETCNGSVQVWMSALGRMNPDDSGWYVTTPLAGAASAVATNIVPVVDVARRTGDVTFALAAPLPDDTYFEEVEDDGSPCGTGPPGVA